MANIFQIIYEWLEVWALFIPLAVLFIYKPKVNWIESIKWYLIVALLLNISIDIMWYTNKYDWFDSRKGHRWNNNILYNVQSAVRIIFFSWFFSTQGKSFKLLSRVVPLLFLVASVIYILFSSNSIFNISSILMATEAGLLLILCLWYTFKLIRDDKPTFATTHPPLWIVGGLTLYTAVNFFIFLFYNYLSENFKIYSLYIWDIHNILYLILCVCISIAIYHDSNRK